MSIVLFPGLGADRRMYDLQRTVVPDIVTPDWCDFVPVGSISDFARQIVETIPSVSSASTIGGSSFGGFVAWEIAALVRPKKLILLGSASSPAAIRAYLRALFPVARLLPGAAFAAAPYFGLSAAPLFGATDLNSARVFAAMGRAAAPSFLSWAIRAISRWAPSLLPSSTEVFRLHGMRDRLIRPPSEACALIARAGHLPTITHAREVNRFLESVMAGPDPGRAEQSTCARVRDLAARGP